jgi:hypothetical protein
VPARRLAAIIVLLGAAKAPAQLDSAAKEAIGFTALEASLGASMPTGAGISITQVETLESGTSYRPDTTLFPSQSFLFPSGGNTSISSHATTVGNYTYGTSSLAPDAGSTATSAHITVYETGDWIGSGFLHTGNAARLPDTASDPLQNHSWVGTTGNTTTDTEILRRFDLMLATDNVLAAVGVNNGNSTTLPNLLSQSYNALSVGLSSGNHSAGTTTLDGAGRTRPHLVVPTSATSWATATVTSAAALLLETATTTPALNNAAENPVLRALLMGGANKNVPDFGRAWSNNSTHPLDERFGAGQLDIETSHTILAAGEQSASPSVDTASTGWDLATTSNATATYFFDLSAESGPISLTASLSWNSIVTATDPPGPSGYTFTTTVPNLDLRLYSATDFTLDTLEAESVNTLDNLELVHATSLTPGRYALTVSSDTPSIDYGLAWTAVPEPSTTLLLALAATTTLLAAARRRG